MFIWYTARFEIKRMHYGFAACVGQGGAYVQCWMVPGTIDPLRDWEYDD